MKSDLKQEKEEKKENEDIKKSNITQLSQNTNKEINLESVSSLQDLVLN